MIPHTRKFRRGIVLSCSLIAAIGTTGCGSDSDSSDQKPGKPSTAMEVATPSPRIAVTYDGGIIVVDGKTFEHIANFELEGFNRLNPAGDGRHVLVSHGNEFRALDMGAWSTDHGDHAHHYAGEPALTDIAFTSEEPGHVVPHNGRTALFFDGSGVVETFDSGNLSAGVQPETHSYTTPQPHHGVAVELSDGRLVTSVGNEEERTGIAVLDRERNEIARNADCPGIHGEAIAARETVVFGCQNGALVYRDNVIRKITSPDPYGRIGNQAGAEDSTIVLGDYKVDPNAELERPTRISLIDTESGNLRLVDLGTSYSFRSLARGPGGTALVLGTDGALHVVDPVAGAITSSVPVIAPWEEPEDWQTARPTLFVLDRTAYVTDPASDSVYTVDLATEKIDGPFQLDHAPNEIVGITG
ncbi:hypothetical protein JGU72_29740 [Antrihabitans sp. YC2-6]|nr:zinc metallochaperone AztD [Antrihabitans sp. YC2-6]MBJ8348873.1 hypothetical protein [Antrihabitans sp. YC2-6]